MSEPGNEAGRQHHPAATSKGKQEPQDGESCSQYRLAQDDARHEVRHMVGAVHDGDATGDGGQGSIVCLHVAADRETESGACCGSGGAAGAALSDAPDVGVSGDAGENDEPGEQAANSLHGGRRQRSGGRG